MITKRIIPCLDVKNGRVVKGVNFEGLQDMADPVEMARYYNASGADELVFYDITASVEGRGLFTDILRRVASQIFIPLTVGGGINTLDDFDRVLKCGADKVSVNSGAIRNPVCRFWKNMTTSSSPIPSPKRTIWRVHGWASASRGPR